MGKDKTIKCGFCNKEFMKKEGFVKISQFNYIIIKCANCNAVLGIYKS